MKRRTAGCIALGVAALVALNARQLPQQTVAAGPTPARPTAPEPAYQYVGVASCASSACHRKEGPRGAAGCEYTTWVESDPHRNAYADLFNKKSRAIEAVLKHLPDPKQAAADKDELCLRCHATGTSGANRGPRLSLADGVGCESCHGPAEKWLSLHYLPEWRAKNAAEKKQDGFAAMKDLVVRAEQCASCHVGSAAAAVDHDLIAAGHPRPHFELGNHHAKLPRHWKEKGDNATADFEARLWAVGQVASARQALQLLEHRASAQDAVWPEFAEYDCAACHHALREPSTRPLAAGGNVAWGEWYYSMLSGVDAESGKTASLESLRKEMHKPIPDRETVVQFARVAAKQFDERLRSQPGHKLDSTQARLQRMKQMLEAEKNGAADPGRDHATQLYLGLAAHEQTLGEDRFRAGLLKLRELLRTTESDNAMGTLDSQALRKALQEFGRQLDPEDCPCRHDASRSK